jgi:hypothetical protein
MTKRVVGILMLLSVVSLSACAGATTAPTIDTALKPLAAGEAAPYLTIQSSDGVPPCGVFNVNGHGFKELTMDDFPECKAGTYKVLCLNDKATWLADYVSGTKLASDGKSLGFTSSQDGICGLFPQK